MSDSPDRPSHPLYVVPDFRPPPSGRPRRSTTVLEDLVETCVMKVALVDAALERLEDKVVTKGELEVLADAVTATNRLLRRHMLEEETERAARKLRDNAIMSMLGDILARLPSRAHTSPLPPLLESEILDEHQYSSAPPPPPEEPKRPSSSPSSPPSTPTGSSGSED